jgi:hypothetical protein
MPNGEVALDGIRVEIGADAAEAFEVLEHSEDARRLDDRGGSLDRCSHIIRVGILGEGGLDGREAQGTEIVRGNDEEEPEIFGEHGDDEADRERKGEPREERVVGQQDAEGGKFDNAQQERPIAQGSDIGAAAEREFDQPEGNQAGIQGNEAIFFQTEAHAFGILSCCTRNRKGEGTLVSTNWA